MAILDHQLAVATTVAVDLGVSGAGRQIVLQMKGITTTATVTTCDTEGGAYVALCVFSCLTAPVMEARLPSTTKQFIKVAFADGTVDIILDSSQTNG